MAGTQQSNQNQTWLPDLRPGQAEIKNNDFEIKPEKSELCEFADAAHPFVTWKDERAPTEKTAPPPEEEDDVSTEMNPSTFMFTGNFGGFDKPFP